MLVFKMRRAAGRVQWNIDIPTLIDVLNLIGAAVLLVAAILAFFVPSPDRQPDHRTGACADA